MLLELYICVLRLINLMVYITETLLSTTTYSIFLCLREIPMWQFVVVVVQSLSHVRLFSTPWTAERQASLSFTISWCLLNSWLLSRWYHLTISSSVVRFSSLLQSLPASGIFPMSRLFASGGQRIELQLQLSPSNEYSGLISFKIDWFDLLAV